MVAAGNPQQPAENGVVCDFKVSAWETPRSCISASLLKEGARGPLRRPAAKPKYPIDHKLGCGIGRQSARPLNYLFQHCSLLNYRQNRGTDLITVSQQEPDAGRWEGGRGGLGDDLCHPLYPPLDIWPDIWHLSYLNLAPLTWFCSTPAVHRKLSSDLLSHAIMWPQKSCKSGGSKPCFLLLDAA